MLFLLLWSSIVTWKASVMRLGLLLLRYTRTKLLLTHVKVWITHLTLSNCVAVSARNWSGRVREWLLQWLGMCEVAETIRVWCWLHWTRWWYLGYTWLIAWFCLRGMELLLHRNPCLTFTLMCLSRSSFHFLEVLLCFLESFHQHLLLRR